MNKFVREHYPASKLPDDLRGDIREHPVAEEVALAWPRLLSALATFGVGFVTRPLGAAVIGATPLSCMLYNNPIAYRTDVTAPANA